MLPTPIVAGFAVGNGLSKVGFVAYCKVRDVVLGIWEQLYNPDLKGAEFDTFKKEAGLNSFNLTSN